MTSADLSFRAERGICFCSPQSSVSHFSANLALTNHLVLFVAPVLPDSFVFGNSATGSRGVKASYLRKLESKQKTPTSVP